MISVTIIAKAQPGKGQELAKAWAAAGQRTLAEDPECTSFVLAIDQEDADQIIASEVYTSQAALDAHNASELSQEIVPVLMELSAGPPSIYHADVVEA